MSQRQITKQATTKAPTRQVVKRNAPVVEDRQSKRQKMKEKRKEQERNIPLVHELITVGTTDAYCPYEGRKPIERQTHTFGGLDPNAPEYSIENYDKWKKETLSNNERSEENYKFHVINRVTMPSKKPRNNYDKLMEKRVNSAVKSKGAYKKLVGNAASEVKSRINKPRGSQSSARIPTGNINKGRTSSNSRGAATNPNASFRSLANKAITSNTASRKGK